MPKRVAVTVDGSFMTAYSLKKDVTLMIRIIFDLSVLVGLNIDFTQLVNYIIMLIRYDVLVFYRDAGVYVKLYVNLVMAKIINCSSICTFNNSSKDMMPVHLVGI